MSYEYLKVSLVESYNIVRNLFMLSIIALDFVSNKCSRKSLENLIVSRYEKVAELDQQHQRNRSVIGDIMRIVRRTWVTLACTRIRSNRLVITEKSTTTLLVRNTYLLCDRNRGVSSSALCWYIRGLFLSDGAVSKGEKAILFHSSQPEILAIALCLADRASVALTMYRHYRVTGAVRPYLEVKIPDVYGVRDWFYDRVPEMPEDEHDLAALMAGLLDGDGSVDAARSKVRLSARLNPSSDTTRRKVSIIIKILLKFNLVKSNFIYTKTFQKYDYITLPLSNRNVLKILKKSLDYMLVKYKRDSLIKVLSKHTAIIDQVSIIKGLLSNPLRIRCRTRRYGDKLYKYPYIRGPRHIIEKLSKKLLENEIKFYGPYRVDEYRSEIALPQRFSKYLCEE